MLGSKHYLKGFNTIMCLFNSTYHAFNFNQDCSKKIKTIFMSKYQMGMKILGQRNSFMYV